MECAVCRKQMQSTYRAYVGNTVSEEVYTCHHCGMYEEQFAYGAHRVSIQGRDFVCGDCMGIEGNLQAWRVWFAVIAAREALQDEGKH
jgi:hypothetical protein